MFPIKLGIGIYSLLMFLLYAPADTIKRPLPNKKKRIVRKVSTVLIGLVYIIIILVTKNQLLINLLVSSLLLEAIMVNPLTYKLFKQPFNNYKNYTVA